MNDKTNRISVNVVLDRSGSMDSTRAGTISGYNEYINALRQDKNSEYTITLTQFDAPMATPELTVSYADRALADVPELTEADYIPRGNTPLYDAIGECVRRVDAKDRAVIMLIITDGCENASIEFSKDTVKALIKAREAAGWTFAFLGADIDSYLVGGTVGVSVSNTANYTKGNERALYSNLGKATVMRASLTASIGAQAASSAAFLDDSMKAEMEANPLVAPKGGRPAAPPKFQRTRSREWAVKSS